MLVFVTMSPLPHVPKPVPESSVEVTSRGFTLIELLVVIAIVGVLAALALAAAGRFADSGKQATTASRLRQVHILQMAFAQDNDGRLTPFFNDANYPDSNRTWQEKLFPYLSLVVVSGAKENPRLVLNSPYQKITGGQAIWQEGRSFGLNSAIRSALWDYRVVRVPEPSKVILAGDMEQGNLDYMFTSDGQDIWGNSPSWARRPAYRHAGKKKAMMLFMDGHTELLDAAELRMTPTNGSPSRWRWW